MAPVDDLTSFKAQAAHRAAAFVESGMVVGLGHGSTAVFAVRRIAALLGSGALRHVRCVPCSRAVEREARLLGIPLTTLNRTPVVHLTIDGADEVDGRLDVIKGNGGALLREKIVAQASLREIIVVDDSKCAPALGTHRPVPVEVTPFGCRSQIVFLTGLGARVTLRRKADGTLFRTDQNNLLLDAAFGPIGDPAGLAATLAARAGILEHGLFLGLATDCIVAGPAGLRHLVRTGGTAKKGVS